MNKKNIYIFIKDDPQKLLGRINEMSFKEIFDEMSKDLASYMEVFIYCFTCDSCNKRTPALAGIDVMTYNKKHICEDCLKKYLREAKENGR